MISSSTPIQTTTFTLFDQELILHPYKAIYWRNEKTLILSDLHLGKATHFTKAGIPIPAKAVLDKNLSRLENLIQLYRPVKMILLGDLFHSSYNAAWDEFCAFTQAQPHIEMILVQGNHDFLSEEKYHQASLNVVTELALGPFIFTHESLENAHPLYNLSGHVHPGVRLQGPAKQGTRLPCFYFGTSQGLLPAFGAFTGLAMIQPGKRDQVFIVTSDAVCKMNF